MFDKFIFIFGYTVLDSFYFTGYSNKVFSIISRSFTSSQLLHCSTVTVLQVLSVTISCFYFVSWVKIFKVFLSLNIVGLLFGRQLSVEDFCLCSLLLNCLNNLLNACCVGLLFDQLLSRCLALHSH